MTRLTLSFWIGFLLLSTTIKAEITSTQRAELASQFFQYANGSAVADAI